MTVALAARAYVNHGRWVADCPFCGGAEQAWPDGIRTHEKVPHPFGIADDVLHCGYTGMTCPVEFPREWRAIGRVLAARSDERTRNWNVHETLNDLKLENESHGLV